MGKIRVLCFGDSNTWGFVPSVGLRYDENTRWTRVLGKLLGEKYEIIEEGLNSRTICTDDSYTGKEGRCGITYLAPCIRTHDKFHYFVLMLGTNELKDSFENSPQDILDMLAYMIKQITDYRSMIDGEEVKLIVCGIPPVEEDDRPADESDFVYARVKRDAFCKLLEKYCAKNGITFINNDDLQVGSDGVHLTAQSHTMLAKKIANEIETK